MNAFVYVSANPITFTDPSGRCGPWCIVAGAIIGGVASTASYGLSVMATGQQWEWGQAGIAFGTGAVTGAVCAGSLMLACTVTSGATSALQYLAAPGDKSASALGLSVATGAIFAVTPVFRNVPYRPPLSPHLARTLTWWSQHSENLLRAAAINLPRSFIASTLGAFEQIALGAEIENK